MDSQNQALGLVPPDQIDYDLSQNDETEVSSLSWNQNHACFAAGTSRGFRIYNCDPFKEVLRRNLETGDFRIVQMLFRSNILALVGGDANSKYPPNKVMIWDDHQGRCLGEFSYISNICGVRLRRDLIVIILEHIIYVYGFKDLKLLHQIGTSANPKGLCCLSHHTNNSVMACPGLHRGQVRVEHFGLNVTKFIAAHDSQIACIELTMDGLLLATASTKGTLVRIFNTMDGNLLQEVRRGVDKAEIYNISLSSDVKWLAVSSDKGTVHIFSVKVRAGGEYASLEKSLSQPQTIDHQNSSTSLDFLVQTSSGTNPHSSLAFMKGVLPKYFSSEWSFAQFNLPEMTHFLVAFGSDNTVIILGMNGSFYKCSFDPINGGEMVKQQHVRFLRGLRHN